MHTQDLNIKLPKRPKDGYEVDLWTAKHRKPYVLPMKIRYVKNRIWKDLFPNSYMGADFRDEWMVYIGGQFKYRIGGWLGLIEPDWFEPDVFETRDAALTHVMKACAVEIKNIEALLNDARERKREIMGLFE